MCVYVVCRPYIHVISGWHMLSDEALGFLKLLKQIEVRGGGCEQCKCLRLPSAHRLHSRRMSAPTDFAHAGFDDWDGDEGSYRWVSSFGGVPREAGGMLLTHCNKLLGWYPAFAGRYTSAWGKSYGPCKEEHIAKGGDYYGKYMWPVCRPRALAAHDAAVGVGGVGAEATPPYVMSMLYGARVRVLCALRHPVDRLETSYWAHAHYVRRYGGSAAGLHAYIAEQTAAFGACASLHGARRCAFLFELLGKAQSDVFFHCDQILRSLYAPFVAEWHGALGDKGLLVLRVEDLLDDARRTRDAVGAFLGLGAIGRGGAGGAGGSHAPPTISYAAAHAASLNASAAAPMRADTRTLAEAFFAPSLAELAALRPNVVWPKGSTVLDATDIARAGNVRSRSDFQ